MWIAAIVAIPLIALFALSLVAAMAIAAVIGTAYMLLRPSPPRPVARRRPVSPEEVEIELDPRDYRRIPSDSRRD